MLSFSSYHQKLASICQKYSATALYLFGSQSTGKTHAHSDTDIALRFAKEISLKKLALLANELTEIFHTEIDLTDLDDAPLPLQFRIYKARKLLYAKNKKSEAYKRAMAISMYHDHKNFFDRQNRAFEKHILSKGLI